MTDVDADGAFAEYQCFGDVAIRPSLGDQHGNFMLTSRQSIVAFLLGLERRERANWGSAVMD